MPIQAHRNGDARQCGAVTTVQGQSTVFVNGRLWAVDNDPNSHINGRLQAGHGQTVTINGKGVIVHAPDPAGSDNAGHPGPPTDTAAGSDNVFAY